MSVSKLCSMGPVLAVWLGVWLGHVDPAQACSPPRDVGTTMGSSQPSVWSEPGLSAPAIASVVVPAAVDALMLAFQLGYGDRMLPEDIAILQILLGSTQVVYSTLQSAFAFLASLGACTGGGPDRPVMMVGGLVGTFLGSWLIAHGVSSVQVRRHRAGQARLLPTASAGPDGFFVGLGGVF
ncbi:MAG: hypothetical protein ACK6CU_15550 [Deltaproteobacteria bacterium]|jgi:hypothetical protein